MNRALWSLTITSTSSTIRIVNLLFLLLRTWGPRHDVKNMVPYQRNVTLSLAGY
jgi:hypothetical protein